ncbi:MAG: hypothetical protein Kow0098_26450 [Ignavibacteriaceae bacterium]
MLNLLLVIICSSSIALILKQSDVKKGNPVLLLTANYFTASVISLIRLLTGEGSLSVQAFLFGCLLGISFFLSFFAFTRAIRSAGTALATVSSRLSVIIPVLFSVIIYSESPDTLKITGFIFTLVTIILFYFSIRRNSEGSLHLFDYLILLLLLLGIGFNDFAFKIFNNWRPRAEGNFFLLSIFSSAFIFSFLYVFIKKIEFEAATIRRGLVLGIPNILASVFLLGALSELPAIIVFPAANIGIILLTVTGAMLIFRERINTAGWWAIVSGITAVGLLSV